MDSTDANTKQLVSLDTKSQAEVEKLKLKLIESNSSTDLQLFKEKRKRKVLEEEEYTSKIASIIERDFFPDVTKIRFELEYQDAVENNDYEKIALLSKQKLAMNDQSQRSVAPETPSTFETPMRPDEGCLKTSEVAPTRVNEPKKLSNVCDSTSNPSSNLSLNSFLNKYTSEDNESFEELQEESHRKYLEKLEFLNSNSQSHNEKVEKALALPSVETQVLSKALPDDRNQVDRLITWKYTNKNTVMFDPEGVPLSKKEAEMQKPGKVIVHENTRFKSNPFYSTTNKQSTIVSKTLAAIKSGKIGVDGKELNANATPSVNGFKFVPSTPNLAPDSIPDSPLMTWGEIDATPMNIRGDATPLIRPDLTPSSAHFKIPDLPHREVIGQELANRILSKNKSNSKNTNSGAKSTANRGSSFERFNSMSPAAQLLATNKLGVHHSMDRSLQASYSPLMSSSAFSSSRTPTPRQLVTPSPKAKLTPGILGIKPKTGTSSKSTIKSAVLATTASSIPKRPTAAEFF